MEHRSESGGPGTFNPSRHIDNMSFARSLCETLVTISRITSHRSQTKTPDPFSHPFLTHHNYRVVKAVGIAGPSIGQAFVDPRYPEAFKVFLNTNLGANQDGTSKVGVVAGAFSTLLDYSTIVPLKYIVGNLAFWKRDEIYQAFDRIGFTNATIVEVARKPSSRHQTPLRLSFTDRLVFDAYLRNEFSTAFKEDLERPEDPHNPDRPNAFPWNR